MSNKLQFVRRYAKRETSKRPFQIVKTWATPKESDSDQFSGPSATDRRLPEVDNIDPSLTAGVISSDSSDLTYHPLENLDPEILTGPATDSGDANISEIPVVPETEISPTEVQDPTYIPAEENHGTTESANSASPEPGDSGSRSSSQSSESSSDSTSSYKSEKMGSKSEEEQTSSGPNSVGQDAITKWTVKNWIDVDVTEEIQKLSQALQSEDDPELMMPSPEPSSEEPASHMAPSRDETNKQISPNGDETIRQGPPNTDEIAREMSPEKEATRQISPNRGEICRPISPEIPSSATESPGPPASVCEQEQEPLSSVMDEMMYNRSPTPANEPFLEPQVLDTPSKSSTLSSSSLTPKTLSVRLERIEVEKYSLSGDKNGRRFIVCDSKTKKNESPKNVSRDPSTEETSHSEAEEETSSQGVENLKNVSKSVKSKQQQGKKPKGPDEISEADSLEAGSGRSTPFNEIRQVPKESHMESSASSRSSKSPPVLQTYSRQVANVGGKKRQHKKDTDVSLQDESDMSASKDGAPVKKSKVQETSPKSKSKTSMKSKSRKSPQTQAESPLEETKTNQIASRKSRRSPKDQDVGTTEGVEHNPESEISTGKAKTPEKVSSSKEPSKRLKMSKNITSTVEESGNSAESASGQGDTLEKKTNHSNSPQALSTAPNSSRRAKGNAKSQSKKQSKKSKTRADTLSSNQEEETVQTGTLELQTADWGKQSTTAAPDSMEDINEDAVSVDSSLRLEVVVDFEETPSNVVNEAKKVTASSASSSWKGKKISASKKSGGQSTRILDRTLSHGSDDTMGLVTSAPPSKKKLPKKAVAKKSDTVRKEKPKAVTPSGRGRGKRVTSDEDSPGQSMSVSVWSGPSQPRRGTDVMDLDIVLQCLQGVERDMYEEAESRPSEKATQRVSTFVRREVHKTICQVQEIKHRQSEGKKIRAKVKTLRADIQQRQHDKMKLNSRLKKLRSTTGIDEDLINLNSWLDDYDKLIQVWDKSKAAQTKPQKYKWFGDVPEEVKAIC